MAAIHKIANKDSGVTNADNLKETLIKIGAKVVRHEREA